MSIIRCPICENTVDSDLEDCMDHPLSGDMICSGCGDDLAEVLETKLDMTMDRFKSVCDLVREFSNVVNT